MPNFSLFSVSISAIVKGFVIFGLLLYSVFAFVIIKQVKLMTETLKLGFEMVIKVIAYSHFLFTIGLIVLALILL